jgi:hypothetical protein
LNGYNHALEDRWEKDPEHLGDELFFFSKIRLFRHIPIQQAWQVPGMAENVPDNGWRSWGFAKLVSR